MLIKGIVQALFELSAVLNVFHFHCQDKKASAVESVSHYHLTHQTNVIRILSVHFSSHILFDKTILRFK